MNRALRIAACTLAVAIPVAAAAGEEPSFADLLARARAQVAAGHKWAPPGDNVNETFSLMIDRLHSATPEQVAEFEAMLTQAQQDADTIASQTRAVTQTPDGMPPPVQAPADQTRAAVAPAHDEAPLPTVDEQTRHAADTPARDEAPPPGPAADDQTRAVVAPARNEMTAPAPAAKQTARQTEPPGPAHVEMASRTMPVAPEPQGVRETAPTPAMPPAPAAPKPAAAAPAPAPVAAQLAPYANEMFNKGKAAEKQGDISGARRYYAVAAQGGHAEAAQAAGRLYDPNFLKGKVMGGIDPDPQMAAKWYALAARLSPANGSPNTPAISVK